MGIDKDIKDKFEERAIQPSVSAWERLSDQLDMHARRKRRRRFFYISSAASILLLVSVFLLSTKTDTIEEPIIPEKMIVDKPVKLPELKKELNNVLEENDAIVAAKNISKEEITPQKVSIKKGNYRNKKVVPAKTTKTIAPPKEVIAIIKNPVAKENKIKTDLGIAASNKKSTSRISVNSDALLYSVTHTEKEVIAYYRAHKLDREDVLKSIKLQLKKSNLKIDARAILADVERDIDDASFKENFMKIIKKRVSDLATAIASRND
ncbi:hypothetical protein RQM59_05855 [Flavobacteriaceae bacterium S356]|uniref:Uncharacterized protein n=1 Tax=Asprobacillus argus TaxID=3076534 RepID=A0ABU3LDV2_9FLAO|nr:hypothetical protein [Flavobacteriaceae bacterium S356]